VADAEDRPIGTAKAAEILGRSPRSVQRAAHTGAIPVLGKLNERGDLLFSQKTIEDLAKKGETPEP
jgi:hypothetical protein